jgi:hypothetical protein
MDEARRKRLMLSALRKGDFHALTKEEKKAVAVQVRKASVAIIEAHRSRIIGLASVSRPMRSLR